MNSVPKSCFGRTVVSSSPSPREQSGARTHTSMPQQHHHRNHQSYTSTAPLPFHSDTDSEDTAPTHNQVHLSHAAHTDHRTQRPPPPPLPLQTALESSAPLCVTLVGGGVEAVVDETGLSERIERMNCIALAMQKRENDARRQDAAVGVAIESFERQSAKLEERLREVESIREISESLPRSRSPDPVLPSAQTPSPPHTAPLQSAIHSYISTSLLRCESPPPRQASLSIPPSVIRFSKDSEYSEKSPTPDPPSKPKRRERRKREDPTQERFFDDPMGVGDVKLPIGMAKRGGTPQRRSGLGLAKRSASRYSSIPRDARGDVTPQARLQLSPSPSPKAPSEVPQTKWGRVDPMMYPPRVGSLSPALPTPTQSTPGVQDGNEVSPGIRMSRSVTPSHIDKHGSYLKRSGSLWEVPQMTACGEKVRAPFLEVKGVKQERLAWDPAESLTASPTVVQKKRRGGGVGGGGGSAQKKDSIRKPRRSASSDSTTPGGTPGPAAYLPRDAAIRPQTHAFTFTQNPRNPIRIYNGTTMG